MREDGCRVAITSLQRRLGATGVITTKAVVETGGVITKAVVDLLASEDETSQYYQGFEQAVRKRHNLAPNEPPSLRLLVDELFVALDDDELAGVRPPPHPQGDDALLRGSVLFFLFHQLAPLPSLNNDLDKLPEETAAIDRLVSDNDFLLFFSRFYAFPLKFGLRRLEFHKAGTTSFIFKADLREIPKACALKVIQAQYTRVESIRSATKRYAEAYGIESRYSPHVHDSDYTWILMDFVEGRNLYDFLAGLRRPIRAAEFPTEHYVTTIATLFERITTALAYYENKGKHHGDLTPFNIIVEERPGVIDVKLIDFGPNYVLRERLGRGQGFVDAYRRIQLFMAPEMLPIGHVPEKLRGDTYLFADLYSFGLIVLDALGHSPLEESELGDRLRQIWQHSETAGIAQLVEDLIDKHPESRALVLEPRDRSYYFALGDSMAAQVKLFKGMIIEQKRTLSVVDHVLRFFKFDVLAAISTVVQIMRTKSPYRDISTSQLISAKVNAGLFLAIISTFAFYTFIDAVYYFNFSRSTLGQWDKLVAVKWGMDIVSLTIIEWLHNKLITGLPSTIELLGHRFNVASLFTDVPKVGDLENNILGRAVGLTFGLIAGRYYANIFSLLRISHSENRRHHWTNRILRANSYSYFLPIMATLVINPRWWPFCSFIGTLFPALNNFLCLRVSQETVFRFRNAFTLESHHRSATDKFLQTYHEWWILMFYYSIGIGVIAFALVAGLAQDEKIYALVICLINIIKIYRNNCGAEAPYMSGHLNRLFFTLRRCQLQEAASGTGVIISARSGTLNPNVR